MIPAGGGRRRVRVGQALLGLRGAALLAAFLLALHGFGRAYAALRGHPGGIADNLLHAIRLVTGQFPDELDGRDLPWTLTVARWAVPLLTLWTMAGVAWLRLRNPVRLRWIRRRGEHLVLAGGPPLAPALAAANAAARRPTLLWLDDVDAPWVRGASDAGQPSTPALGEGGASVLGLARARAALLVHDEDARNISLANAVLEEAARTRPPGDPLPVLARVDNLDLRAAAEGRIVAGDPATARLRLVSLPDVAARRLFVDAPLDGFVRVGGTERLVVTLGFSPLVESYVLRLLAGGHYRDGTRPRIVVLAPDAARREGVFRARRPGAETLAPVLFETAPIDEPALVGGLLADAVARHGAPVALVIDPGDEARALALAFAAETWFRHAGLAAPPIHARIGACPDAQLGAMIHRLGGADRLADPEELLQEEHDALARSIHDVYLEGRLTAGQGLGTHAALAEWDELPESVRDDNRLVADCYRLKLRDIGARLMPGDGPPLRPEPEEVEELARAEHDRWMAAKLVAGWRYGADRDDVGRLHPDIVPYDALSEPIRELDREQIRLMTRLLPKARLVPRRLLTVLVEHGDGGTPAADALARLRARYPDRLPVLIGRFDHRAVRQALAEATGVLAQLALTDPVETILERAPAPGRAAARALVRRADTIWAFPSGSDAAVVDGWLAARADARIEVADG